jgi:hypothetical protein
LTLPFKNTADAGYRITEHTCHRMMLSLTDGTSTGAIACGTYPLDDAFGRSSVWLFLAKMAGRPITVAGRLFTETRPMVDPDNGDSRIVTIPRWAAGILPASGTDCHADRLEPVTKIIHSSWQFKRIDRRLTAALYIDR